MANMAVYKKTSPAMLAKISYQSSVLNQSTSTYPPVFFVA